MIVTPVGRGDFAAYNCNYSTILSVINIDTLGRVIRLYYKVKKYNIYLIEYYTRIVIFEEIASRCLRIISKKYFTILL
jgi:hypothetical protein